MKSKYENKKLKKLVKQGLYDPVFEHDACGVGMVANIKGKQSHSIVSQGLEALSHLAHRGAAGADPETGDGAGILIQMPHDFFKSELSSTGCDLPDPGQYGVGMSFLPSDKDQAELSRSLIEECVSKQGYDLLAWRQVPIDTKKIGVLANRDRPHITQFFVILFLLSREVFLKTLTETCTY